MYIPRAGVPPSARATWISNHASLAQKSDFSSSMAYSKAAGMSINPLPELSVASGAPSPSALAVAWTMRLILAGLAFTPSSLSAAISKAMAPQQHGLLMLVPFMSVRFSRDHRGTGAMAPPGADTSTPTSPSVVGPRELQVYWIPPSFPSSSGGTSRTLCPTAASSAETHAPTPRMAAVVPPGAPTVDRAGPSFPAEETKVMSCFRTSCSATSTNLPALGVWVASP
mmetsp:Transcript_6059/g.37553  ORF Transcript_6059/g.37553 Transcript_6059/m.37553 type:complete len:226 (-) Transcript_6059:1093-1770(-)